MERIALFYTFIYKQSRRKIFNNIHLKTTQQHYSRLLIIHFYLFNIIFNNWRQCRQTIPGVRAGRVCPRARAGLLCRHVLTARATLGFCLVFECCLSYITSAKLSCRAADSESIFDLREVRRLMPLPAEKHRSPNVESCTYTRNVMRRRKISNINRKLLRSE